MKIVCYLCKKVIGEQKPFDNPAEVLAKCTNCLAKEKEQALQALKKEPMPEPGQPREVILENGLKGMLSVGGAETEKLSFWDMIFAGKKFFCISSVQKEFQQYLAGISAEEVDVTFLHSSVIKIDTPLKGRRRKKTPDIAEEKKLENKSIDYNCTIRISKQSAELLFNGKAEQNKGLIELLAEMAYESYKKDRQKVDNLDSPVKAQNSI